MYCSKCIWGSNNPEPSSIDFGDIHINMNGKINTVCTNRDADKVINMYLETGESDMECNKYKERTE